jgi:hypothetical protein
MPEGAEPSQLARLPSWNLMHQLVNDGHERCPIAALWTSEQSKPQAVELAGEEEQGLEAVMLDHIGSPRRLRSLPCRSRAARPQPREQMCDRST